MSGADAANRAARIDAAIKGGGIIERFFEKATWNKLNERDRVLLVNNGINEKTFNALKKIKRSKHGIVEGKEFENADVKGLTDEFTTKIQARRNLEFRYYHLLGTVMDEFSPLPSVQGELTWSRGAKKNTPHGALLTLMFKFSNIGQSAYIHLHRPLRRQVGLDPNLINSDPLNSLPMRLELAQANPMYLGKVMVSSALGGMMINWTSELANNEPLSAITPGFIAKGLLRTSAIGYVGELANNIYYGGGFMGDTTESIFKSAQSAIETGEAGIEWDEEKAWNRLLKAKRTMPITNVWWTGLAIDKAVRNGMDVPYSGYQKQKFDERGRLTEDAVQQWDDVSSYIPGRF